MNNEEFFSDIVFGWMCKDIEREIELARKCHKAGNVLCALALTAYTEFMGRKLRFSGRPPSKDKQFFDAFFKTLGSEYEELLLTVNVYNIFRCGLVHEYFVKRSCTITMLNTPNKPLEIAGQPPTSVPRPVRCGIGVASNGSYYFVVEKYLEDFKNACKSLQDELASSGAAISINHRITSDPG